MRQDHHSRSRRNRLARGDMKMAATKTQSGGVGAALSWLLLICAAAHLPAQATTPATSPGLLITILDGEGALNDIRKGTAREPIVQVEDENHRPVAGAA